MKRISLDRLESQLPEHIITTAETLAGKTGLPVIEEVDEHLWVAVIDHMEVEILLNGRSTSQYTCECKQFSDRGHCEHIALTMMALRQALKPEKSFLSNALSSSSGRIYGSKRLTTASLLEHASDDKLRNFIKAYARENRGFALAFRARFSSNVPTTSEEEKYRNLINSIFNSQYKPGKPYTATATAQVAQLLHYVIQDVAEQVSQGQFQAPVLMVRVLIEKLPPILNLAGAEKEELLKMLRKGLKLLERMASEPVSPSLHKELWHILEGELSKPYCIKNDLHTNILELLACLAPELGRDKDYLRLLVHLSATPYLTESQQTGLQSLHLSALFRAGRTDEVQASISDLIRNPQLAIGVLQSFLLHKTSSELVGQLVDAAIASNLPLESHQIVAFKLIDWLQEQGRTGDALRLACLCYIERPEAETLQSCRQLAGDRWDATFDMLMARIQEHPEMSRDEKNRQIASMLYQEGRTSELLRHLAGQESLALLRRYTPSLLPDAQSLLLDVYYRYFENYLREYLGRKPAMRVRSTIESLRQDGACHLADDLLDRIRRAFPQRRSLIEELEML